MLFKTLWGHRGSYDAAAREAVEHGFQGLEGRVPTTAKTVAALAHSLRRHALHYIGEVVTGGDYVPRPGDPPEAHLAELEHALPYARALGARFVNCIVGSDSWSFADSVAFFRHAIALGERHQVQLSFETHRSRVLFHPWVTLQMLRRVPKLKLTCDFSHWCVVCERLFDREPEIIAQVAPHAHHIHARVGYDQGPQVPHPAAPEYANALRAHRSWWSQIWAAQAGRGEPVSTMTPEFGPDGYLHTLPYTQAPVADLWQINCWMAATERARFARRPVPAPAHACP